MQTEGKIKIDNKKTSPALYTDRLEICFTSQLLMELLLCSQVSHVSSTNRYRIVCFSAIVAFVDTFVACSCLVVTSNNTPLNAVNGGLDSRTQASISFALSFSIILQECATFNFHQRVHRKFSKCRFVHVRSLAGLHVVTQISVTAPGILVTWMLTHFFIHQTHYEKSDWSRAFNQFTIDMINAISTARYCIYHVKFNVCLVTKPLGVFSSDKMAQRFASCF